MHLMNSFVNTAAFKSSVIIIIITPDLYNKYNYCD